MKTAIRGLFLDPLCLRKYEGATVRFKHSLKKGYNPILVCGRCVVDGWKRANALHEMGVVEIDAIQIRERGVSSRGLMKGGERI